MMLPNTFNKKAFNDVNKLQEINSKLFDLNLKKKEISSKIIEYSKIEKSKLKELEIEKLFNNLSEIDRKIASFESEKMF